MTHDHLIECRNCGIVMADIRDCVCARATAAIPECKYCYADRIAEMMEYRRNA